MSGVPNESAPDAILSTDTDARLSAIIRRHGGKPKPVEHADGRPKFPRIGQRKCPDQIELFATKEPR